LPILRLVLNLASLYIETAHFFGPAKHTGQQLAQRDYDVQGIDRGTDHLGK
jgi:hypothetical protein